MHSTKDQQPSADVRSWTYACFACPITYSSISGIRGYLNIKMPCNGVNIRSSMQENLSLGPRVRTAKALTGAGHSVPLLFAFWKASYLNLLQAEF